MNCKDVLIAILIIIILWLLYINYYKRNENYTNSENKFKITFKTMWGKQNVNIGYPSDPHTGNMFLAVHNNNYNLFENGKYASAGIEQSSEFGLNDNLIKEAINNSKNIKQYYTSPVLNTPGQTEFTVDASTIYPLFSFATMIAPSSNWFTGISSVNLFNVPKNIDIPLYAYDAGTDTGVEFVTLPKHPRIPHRPISFITNGVLFPNGNQIPFAFINVQSL